VRDKQGRPRLELRDDNFWILARKDRDSGVRLSAKRIALTAVLRP
jgi:hypothetical protein